MTTRQCVSQTLGHQLQDRHDGLLLGLGLLYDLLLLFFISTEDGGRSKLAELLLINL